MSTKVTRIDRKIRKITQNPEASLSKQRALDMVRDSKSS